MKIIQRIHYAEDDLKFQRDYYSVDLIDSAGKIIRSYGDAYHESGLDKVEGFLAGVAYGAREAVSLVTERVADGVGG